MVDFRGCMKSIRISLGFIRVLLVLELQQRCGAVLDGDRWSGFNRGQSPVAWALWPDAAELIATISALEKVDAA